MDAFLGDETLKSATIRSLEIIGEATEKIPADQKLRWLNLGQRLRQTGN
jgi:uncharacterized protein with HEPN domain